jgi:hypothetical protein
VPEALLCLTSATLGLITCVGLGAGDVASLPCGQVQERFFTLVQLDAGQGGR